MARLRSSRPLLCAPPLPQDARNQTGFVLEQLQQQAVDLGQAVSAAAAGHTAARAGRILPAGCCATSPYAGLHMPERGRADTCLRTPASRPALQAAAMPMRVQKIESTMALLETGDLKLRVRCACSQG